MINVYVYLAELLLRVFFTLTAFLMNSSEAMIMEKIINWLACPASFQNLLYQPWSIATSLFLHSGFWHLFMNMLMLYVSGKIFLQYLDSRKLITTYFLGGIFGNFIYMLSYTYFPVFQDVLSVSHALGASGSIMAILAAITFYRPQHEVNLILIGPVKLYWIMIVFVVVDLLSIPNGNAGGHIAHLGGVMYGIGSQYLYHSYSQKTKRKKSKKSKSKFTTSYDNNWRPMSDEEYNAQKVKEQQKVDEILDKISKNGYDALTKAEKDFLFHFSKK